MEHIIWLDFYWSYHRGNIPISYIKHKCTKKFFLKLIDSVSFNSSALFNIKVYSRENFLLYAL